MKEIVLCSDGSEQACKAAQIAADLAHNFQANVTLLSVFNEAPLVMAYGGAPEGAPYLEVIPEIEAEFHALAQCKVGKILQERGIRYYPREETGHPVDTIVSVAESIKADLIVLGSRGRSTFKSLLLGSVSDGVLHHAHCPVLIVR